MYIIWKYGLHLWLTTCPWAINCEHLKTKNMAHIVNIENSIYVKQIGNFLKKGWCDRIVLLWRYFWKLNIGGVKPYILDLSKCHPSLSNCFVLQSGQTSISRHTPASHQTLCQNIDDNHMVGWVLPYLGMVGRFRSDDPHFGHFQSDWILTWCFQNDLIDPLFLQKNLVCLYHI